MNEQAISSELTEAQAAIQGDRGAMVSLWRRHRRWVAAVLLSYKPRWEDLDDLLQEVAMTVVTSIHTVRDPRHVRSWLRTVAINAARSAGRARRPMAAAMDADGLEFAGLAAQPVPANGKDGEVERMLALAQQLPDAYREPLMLRAVRGLSSRQVGEILDLPIATVDTRVCRARRMLREMVEQEQVGDEGPDPSGIDGPTDSRRRGDRPRALRLAASGDA